MFNLLKVANTLALQLLAVLSLLVLPAQADEAKSVEVPSKTTTQSASWPNPAHCPIYKTDLPPAEYFDESQKLLGEKYSKNI